MNNIFEDVNGIVEKIKDRKNRIIAGAVAAVMTLYGIGIGVSISKKKDDKIYFRDLRNDVSVCTLYDADGNVIEAVNDVSCVATFDNELGDSELAAVVTDDGKIKLGYIDGEQIEDDYSQVIEDVDASEFSNVSMVAANSGVYLRQNKIVDRHTDDAILLPKGTYLLGHCDTETSADNAYNWRKVIYLDGENIQFGYIASEYLLDTDLSLFEGEIFEINSEKQPLKLRSEPVIPADNSSDNIIEKMQHGDNVYLIPNVSSKYYDEEKKIDWRYVAYQNADGEVNFGWCASSIVTSDGRNISYLKEVVKEADLSDNSFSNSDNDNEKKNMYMVVDTSKADYVELKLREKPDLDSNILSRLENGTNIIVSSNDWNNMVREDNFDWVKVTTDSGKTGYVASEYLKEAIKVDGYDGYELDTIDLGDEGSLVGYVGIDCAPAYMTPGHLESLLNGTTSLCSSRGSNTDKPNFVIIKLGATGYGEQVEEQQIVDPNLYKSAFNLARICEEYKVPYSFYYFCSALPKDEVDGKIISSELDAENEYIVNSIRGYVANNESDYFMRTVYLDIENDSTRLRNYHHPSQLSRMYNQQFDYLEKQFKDLYDGKGIEIGIYTDHNALGYFSGSSPIFNYSEIDNKYKDNVWVVDPSNTHSKSFAKNEDEITPAMHQIRLDCGIHQCDVNVMDKEKFESILGNMELSDKIQNSDQNSSSIGR